LVDELVFKLTTKVGVEQLYISQVTLDRRKSSCDKARIFVGSCAETNDFAIKEIDKNTYVMLIFDFNLC